MLKSSQDRKLKHLFDGGDWNVYAPNILNLGVGAPGPDILTANCDSFRTATDHCLVGTILTQYPPCNEHCGSLCRNAKSGKTSR